MGEGGAEGGREGGVGRGQGDAVCVDGGDERAAVHVGALDGGDLGYVGDRADARGHAFGSGGQLGGLSRGGTGGLDGD